VETTKSEKAFILDGPFDGFTAGELHGLSEGRRKVDVPLFAGFALDELDFGGKTHGQAPYLVN
jgi:hypothetical protein